MIISICGASGTGKSSTAKAITALCPECTRIPTDYFIVPRMPGDSTYFERALEYDWKQFDLSVAGTIGEQQTTPDFDFEHFELHAISGGRHFEIRRILLTDGFYPHPNAAIRVLLECDDWVRRQRLEQRDQAWHANVTQRWIQLERTRERLYREYDNWHLVLPATQSILENAEQIVSLLRAFTTIAKSTSVEPH